MSIFRDFDLSAGSADNLEDISGIVVIDEIDIHLHTHHQHEILPKLISMFPKVQFIITTHSPLFLLGMEKEFNKDGFNIIELPRGLKIDAQIFSEFDAAYETFKKTEKFQAELDKKVTKATLPTVIFEGTTDIQYFRKAAELLGEEGILEKIKLIDGDGEPNLKKFWKNHNTLTGQLLNSKTILIYDCDVSGEDKETGKLYSRIIPLIEGNMIRRGVENLFPTTTIKKAKEYN